MLKRKLRESEALKEARASSELFEYMYEMSPHQLEFLAHLAAKILSGMPVDK
jgi:hypothetical protein